MLVRNDLLTSSRSAPSCASSSSSLSWESRVARVESEYDEPARSCTTPSWRSRAMRTRSASDARTAALQQSLPLLPGARDPAGEQQDQRVAPPPCTASAPRLIGRNRSSTSSRWPRSRRRRSRPRTAAAVPRASRSACRPRAGPRPGPARSGSPGRTGRTARRPSRPRRGFELVLVERVDAADQLGPVAVEDGAVGRPDLDPQHVARRSAARGPPGPACRSPRRLPSRARAGRRVRRPRREDWVRDRASSIASSSAALG